MVKTKASSSTKPKPFAVKIFTTALQYDYEFPWKAPTIERWTGSGFVIDGHKIITNAHVAGGSIFLEVELANDSVKYVATLKAVSHESDLAMLEVEDPHFWEKTTALRIGNTPTQLQKIAVHGFPIGGEGYCITTGKVSRIESDRYAHGEQIMLSTQVSAPINPGNSGGAVINKQHKVVGVVHQSLRQGQNVGYMIPADVLKHFIYQVRTQNMGFPSLNVEIQKMENHFLREKYGMDETQSGILIRNVPPLSCAKGKLLSNDVILQINGLSVNNDGTVSIDEMQRVDYRYLINRSKMGDTVSFQVLREGKPLTVSVRLTDTFDTTHTILPRTFGQQPSYYIISGSVVVQPISKNLQTDWGRSYYNAAKTQKDEQVLVINCVLKNHLSQGYEEFSGEIIEKMNGVEVHNMHELIEATTHAMDACHCIETRSGKKLVLPNLSPLAAAQLLAPYNIEHDCSSDLKTSASSDKLMDDLISQHDKILQFSSTRSLKSNTPAMATLPDDSPVWAKRAQGF